MVLKFYNCLVYWTGVEPSEFFSLQHRPGYADYQRRVSCFVPWEPVPVDAGCSEGTQMMTIGQPTQPDL